MFVWKGYLHKIRVIFTCTTTAHVTLLNCPVNGVNLFTKRNILPITSKAYQEQNADTSL